MQTLDGDCTLHIRERVIKRFELTGGVHRSQGTERNNTGPKTKSNKHRHGQPTNQHQIHTQQK